MATKQRVSQRGLALFLVMSLVLACFVGYHLSARKAAHADETYTLKGGQFVRGKFGRGYLAQKKGDKLLLTTDDNLRREEGTIEMWVRHELPKKKRPDWAPLFTNLLEPYDVGLNNLRGLVVQFMEHSRKLIFILGRFGDTRNVLETSGLDWNAGEDHHVAVSWGPKGMRIYIDGREVAKNNYTGMLPSLHEKMGVGCYAFEGIKEPAAAVIDDLRISNVQRNSSDIAHTVSSNQPVKMDGHTLLITHFEESIVTLASQRPTKPEPGRKPYERYGDVDSDGCQGQNWKRYENNPIIVPGKFKKLRNVPAAINVADPSVLYDEQEHKYKMWFATGGDGGRGKKFLWVLYAESDNGVNWHVYDEPVLEPAPGKQDWDYTNVETPSVVKDPTGPPERRYKLWYSGGNLVEAEIAKGFPFYQIGLAFSSDGKKFTRLPENESPYKKAGLALMAKEGLYNHSFDLGVVADPEVVKKDGKYHMWYSSIAMTKKRKGVAGGVSYAVSDDGIRWKAYKDNPVLPGGSQPSVLWNKDKGIFEMWYTIEHDEGKKTYPIKEAANDIAIGYWYASSADGVRWKKCNQRAFTYDLSHHNEDIGLMTGVEVIYKDGTYRMYYSALGTKGKPPRWYTPFVWALNLATWTPGKR